MSTKKATIEDDLKVNNWLSMLTFDAFKYANLGGELIVRSGPNGLVLELPGITVDNENVNPKFKKLVAAENDLVKG